MFKIGSLCTGYGGLDMAVEAYFNAETVWTSDIDKYASIVIKERIGKPNLGDLKAIDWTQVEPIDILTAGYPCQPFSHAGQRKGVEDERHIFPYIMQAIGILRPRIIVLENVRGHLSLGFKEVLQSLAAVPAGDDDGEAAEGRGDPRQARGGPSLSPPVVVPPPTAVVPFDPPAPLAYDADLPKDAPDPYPCAYTPEELRPVWRAREGDVPSSRSRTYYTDAVGKIISIQLPDGPKKPAGG